MKVLHFGCYMLPLLLQRLSAKSDFRHFSAKRSRCVTEQDRMFIFDTFLPKDPWLMKSEKKIDSKKIFGVRRPHNTNSAED